MDPVAALVLCTPGHGPVDLSVINGRIIVKDGKLTTVDLKVCLLFFAVSSTTHG